MHPRSVLVLAGVLGLSALVQSQYNGYEDLYERDLYDSDDFHLSRREAILEALYARNEEEFSDLATRDAEENSHQFVPRKAGQVCEVCKTPLHEHKSGQIGMTCANCGSAYRWSVPYVIPSGNRKKDDEKAAEQSEWMYASAPRNPEQWPYNKNGEGFPSSKKSSSHRVSGWGRREVSDEFEFE